MLDDHTYPTLGTRYGYIIKRQNYHFCRKLNKATCFLWLPIFKDMSFLKPIIFSNTARVIVIFFRCLNKPHDCMHISDEHQMSDFRIGTTNAAPDKVTPRAGNIDICVSQTEALRPGETRSFYCWSLGRFLVIILQKEDVLSLCEVEVYTRPLDGQYLFGRVSISHAIVIMNQTHPVTCLSDVLSSSAQQRYSLK